MGSFESLSQTAHASAPWEMLDVINRAREEVLKGLISLKRDNLSGPDQSEESSMEIVESWTIVFHSSLAKERVSKDDMFCFKGKERLNQN